MATASENLRGAGLMTLAMAGFTLNDACMKAVSAELPMGQALVLRGLVTLLVLGLWAWRTGALTVTIVPRDRLRLALRTGAEIAAAWFFLTALFNMPLANASAILQALPLTVSLAGAIFLREPLGWRRLLAISLGFAGVLLIIRPGPDGFNVYALSALAAVVAVTTRDLSTRRLSAGVPGVLAALLAAIGVLVFALLLSLTETWVPVTLPIAALVSAAGCFILLAYVFSIATMRLGEIGFVAPFRYTALFWALLLGVVIFGDWPDAVTLVGCGIVVGTGVYTGYRERRAAQGQLQSQRMASGGPS